MTDTTVEPTVVPYPQGRRYLSDPQFIMGCAVLLVSFAVLFLYALGIAKDGDVKTAAVSFITLILGYFYGSSRGSAAKTDTLNDLVKK